MKNEIAISEEDFRQKLNDWDHKRKPFDWLPDHTNTAPAQKIWYNSLPEKIRKYTTQINWDGMESLHFLRRL
jgi:hypothetical protein